MGIPDHDDLKRADYRPLIDVSGLGTADQTHRIDWWTVLEILVLVGMVLVIVAHEVK